MSKPNLSTITRKLTRFLSTDQQLEQDKRARLIAKRGRVNIFVSNVERRNFLYLSDPFTTLIDCKWYWIFLVFSASFLSSWLIFGSFWWLITWLRDGHEPGRMTCVENVNSWTSAFLFSIETQTTIGYGGRQVSNTKVEYRDMTVIIGRNSRTAISQFFFYRQKTSKLKMKFNKLHSKEIFEKSWFLNFKQGSSFSCLPWTDEHPTREV